MSEQQNTLNRYYINVRKIWEKPTVKRFSTTTATLSLVAFFLLVALKPTIETIFTLNKKIADSREIETQMSKKIADLNQAYSTYQAVQADLPLLDEYYPTDPQAEQVIKILESNSKNSGMEDINYTLSAYQFQKGTGQIGLEYSGANSFLNSLNFLQNLIDARRLIVLTNIRVNKIRDSAKININVGGNIYYEKK